MTATPPGADGSLYVYGIVPKRAAVPRASGVGGAVVRLVTGLGLSAAVSAAPEGLRARRRDLTAHQAVLDELAGQGPVLPMRFATLVSGEDELRRQLRERRAHFGEQLESLRGCVEMNVKGDSVPGFFEQLVRTDDELRALARRTRQRPDYEANVRLGEALAQAVRREARRAADDVLSRLTPLARRVAHGTVDGPQVLSASFLVPREELARFRKAVDRGARRHGDRLALRVTGPLPCYSFVDTTAAAPASLSTPAPVSVSASAGA